MFVLLTTSNFPNVMLPSYNEKRIYSVYFVTYLIIGLFLLSNLLLAVFYSSYQDKTDNAIDKNTKSRSEFVGKLVVQLDEDKKGHLSKDECRELILQVHQLVENVEIITKKNSMELGDRLWAETWEIIDREHLGYLPFENFKNVLFTYE
jgi:hypothetical protein